MRRNFLYLLASAAVLSLASCTTTSLCRMDLICWMKSKFVRTKKIYGLLPCACMFAKILMPSGSVLIKTQLYVYNLSGRVIRPNGETNFKKDRDAPVIYSEDEAKRSEEEITKAVHNMDIWRHREAFD
jgi:hypothetical protein